MLIPMAKLVARYGVRPKGILHLGAHTGEEAEAYARAGVERVVWFEANPEVIAALERRLAAFPTHRVVQAAVAECDGRLAEFHIASNEHSSSLLKMKRHRDYYPHIMECGTVSMRTATVDTLLERDGLSPADFDFANLDLQGAELLALQGMQRSLRHLAWVYAEVNFEELYEGCPLVGAMDRYLKKHSFKRVATVDKRRGWGDALYARRPVRYHS